MAVCESHLFSRIRGSIGDNTYCQSQANAIVCRARIVSPSYPDTYYQQQVKASLSYALTQWSSLTNAERSAWESYGLTLKTRKMFAVSALTGRQAFIQTISFIKYFQTIRGVPLVLDNSVPTEKGVLNIGPIVEIPFTTAGATGVAWNIVNPNDFDCLLFIVRSVDLPVTRNKWDSPFQGITAANRTIPANSTFEFQRSLPGGYSGKAVFHKMRFCPSAAPFKISKITIVRGVAVTNP